MITGNNKFFEKSKCLQIDGATAAVSSGTNTADFIIDQNNYTYWRSSSSNDLTTETIEIEFDEVEIDRIFLMRHNLKDYKIEYWNGSAWTHFSSVVGITGSLANITETVFEKNVSYYEFSPVTTSKILVTALKTQVANEEKYISQVICTKEIGTFAGFPRVKDLDFDKNSRTKKTISGKYSIQKSFEVASFGMELKDYPTDDEFNVDLDLVTSLYESEDPFLVWLCGGKYGKPFFRYTIRGYRLEDLFQMKVSKPIKTSYNNGVYINPLNLIVDFEESI